MANAVIVEMKGHILDSLTLSKVMDIAIANGAHCEVVDMKVGEEKTETSCAKLKISASDKNLLNSVILKLEKQGAVVIQTAA